MVRRRLRIGIKLCTLPCSLCRVVLGDAVVFVVATKSPGTVSGAPYTNSADDVQRSSSGAVRIPSRVYDSSSIQPWPVSCARNADLRFL